MYFTQEVKKKESKYPDILLGQIEIPQLNEQVVKKSEPYVDLEEALSKAVIEKEPLKQVQLLSKLAELYIFEQKYIEAALILNGAKAILNSKSIKDNLNLRVEIDLIDEKINSLEPALIKKLVNEQQYIYKPLNIESYGVNPSHKASLEILKATTKSLLNEISPLTSLPNPEQCELIEGVSKLITEESCLLLKQIIEDCIFLLQTPAPCGYAFVGTGSLARYEMTPYSDLECFLLIEVDSSENHRYFINLCELLKLKIINLGATDLTKGYTLLPFNMTNPTPKGFSLDVHKNPTNASHSLIGTPEKLAQYQLPEQYLQEKGNHFSGAFLNLIFITGTQENLLQNFKNEISKIHELKETSNATVSTLKVSRALAMLNEDVECFEPILEVSNEGKLFQAKIDLYRLPQTIIDAIALIENLSSTSSWGRLQELKNKKFITELGYDHLRQLFSMAAWFRLKAYSCYDAQQENLEVFFKLEQLEEVTKKSFYTLDKQEIDVIVEMYKILFPLHACVVTYCKSNGYKNTFTQNSFFDDTKLTSGRIAARLCLYKEAYQFFKEAAIEATKSDNLSNYLFSSNHLATLAISLGDMSLACYHLDLLVNIYFRFEGPKSINGAKFLMKYALAMPIIQGVEKAKEALEIAESLKAFDLSDLINMKSDFAILLIQIGRVEEATQILLEVKKIQDKLNKKELLSLVNFYIVVGKLYLEKYKIELAWEAYSNALKVIKKDFGLRHPVSADAFLGLAHCYRAAYQHKSAFRFYSLCITILKSSFDSNHPKIAEIYISLSELCFDTMDMDYSEEYLLKALEINSSQSLKNLMCLAKNYTAIARLYSKQNKIKEAQYYYDKAKEILLDPQNHYFYKQKANLLIEFATDLYLIFDQTKPALRIIDLAFSIILEKIPHEVIIRSEALNIRGKVLIRLGELKQALLAFREAVELLAATFGPGYPKCGELAESMFHGLSLAGYNMFAMQIYQLTLKSYNEIYGPNHKRFLEKFIPYHQVNLIETCISLGMFCYNEKKYTDSKYFFQLALKVITPLFGTGHPSGALLLFRLAQVEHSLGNSQAFLKLIRQSFEKLKLYDNLHPTKNTILQELELMSLEDVSECDLKFKPYMSDANSIKSDYIKLMDILLYVMYLLGTSYNKLEDSENAIFYLKSSVELNKNTFGSESYKYAAALFNLGSTYENFNEIDNAQNTFVMALKVGIVCLESEDPFLLKIASRIKPQMLEIMGVKLIPIVRNGLENIIVKFASESPLIFSSLNDKAEEKNTTRKNSLEKGDQEEPLDKVHEDCDLIDKKDPKEKLRDFDGAGQKNN